MIITALCTLAALKGVDALSSPTGYYDRFRATCPADMNCIYRYNPSLVNIDDKDKESDDVWVAVYRSKNNLPSVFLKDEFLNAMDIATSVAMTGNEDKSKSNPQIETKQGKEMGSEVTGITANVPVAVARLRPSANKWIIDSMRCSLKKEDTNPDCDGGSEHTEALSICIDELIIEHLTRQTEKLKNNEETDGSLFEEALRCKATLVAAPLFEARGFSEVTELSLDMATHTSTLNASMDKYASRVAGIGSAAKSPGARDRALKILSLLGQLDANREKQAASEEKGDSDEEEYDPWASVKRYI